MSPAGSRSGTRKEAFAREVRRRRERHDKHLRDGDSSFWQSVGMMGTIGWSVAVPTVLGVLVVIMPLIPISGKITLLVKIF